MEVGGGRRMEEGGGRRREEGGRQARWGGGGKEEEEGSRRGVGDGRTSLYVPVLRHPGPIIEA